MLADACPDNRQNKQGGEDMEDRKLDKNLIFFIPGKPGSVFTYQAGYTVNNDLLSQTVEHLEYDTENKIRWVEERRAIPRPA
jgi:hypothetical protein